MCTLTLSLPPDSELRRGDHTLTVAERWQYDELLEGGSEREGEDAADMKTAGIGWLNRGRGGKLSC